jgi:hypothetical protein
MVLFFLVKTKLMQIGLFDYILIKRFKKLAVGKKQLANCQLPTANCLIIYGLARSTIVY